MLARLIASIFVLLLLANEPAAAQGKFVILMPGAGGGGPIDFLIRNKSAFDAAGLRTGVATSSESALSLSQSAHRNGQKVIIVAMSRGGLYAASALASGAPTGGIVFVSSNYKGVADRLGSNQKLPSAVLLVHHRQDECRMTSPAGAQRFIGWSGGRARIAWIETRGAAKGDPCGPLGAHGFFQQDGPAISAIIDFIRSQ